MCRVKAKETCREGGRGWVMGIRSPQGEAVCGPVPVNLVPKGLIKIVMFFLNFFLQYPQVPAKHHEEKMVLSILKNEMLTFGGISFHF
jgi:hypothetical protein